jgi:hypothetical protein
MADQQWESTTDQGAGQPQWETTGDHAAPDSLVGKTIEAMKQFASGAGEELNPVTLAKGINNLAQGAFWHPIDTAKGIAANNAQAWERAKAAYQRGDYGSAAAHFVNYLIPGGSSIDPISAEIEHGGNLAHAAGESMGLGVTLAAPDSPYVKTALAKLPEAARVGAGKANQKLAGAVQWAQDRGIPVDAGTATGNDYVKGVQKLADYTPAGSMVAQGARNATDTALERVSGDLMDQANPTSVAPGQAGSDVTQGLQSNIRARDAEADRAYGELREIEADPANLRNVQTGTRQVPVKDPKTGMEIPGQFTSEPVMEDVPLPVDMRPVKEALQPIRDQIRRGMPIAQQRASKGLLALDNIIDGPDAQRASVADSDLSAIKEAARGADMPELRTLSQGTAAQAVKALHDAVSEAVSKAERAPAGFSKWQRVGDKLVAYDGEGNEISQPAPGVKIDEAPNVPTPEEQLDRGPDARATEQGAAPDQQGGAGPRDARTTAIVPGSPTTYGATYEIRELGDLEPSHNGQTFSPNPQYPLRNDRNYSNPANQRKVVEWSTPEGFDPRYHITDNPDATNGPPLVDSDGNVLGGNGRTMIMQRVYAGNPEGAAAYRGMLEQRAAQFGLDPKEVAKYNQPVLVRVIDDAELSSPAKVQDAVTDFNKTGTAALTPAEQAVADARRVSPDTLQRLSDRLGELGPDATTAQAIEGRHGVDMLHNLIGDGVIAPQEAARYATEDALTQAGKQRITQLLLGRFFRDADQLDSLPAAIRNKVDRIAGPLARLEAHGDYALTEQVKSGIDLLETARAKGLSVEDYLQQGGLFNKQKYTPQAQAIALGLRDGNPAAIAQQLNVYAEHASYANGYQGPGMFGEFPQPKNPAQAFNHAFGTTLPEQARVLYHGTSAKPFTEFADGLAYLTDEPREARQFAQNPLIGGGRGEGEPRVLRVEANSGSVKDISDTVDEAMANDEDIDQVIEREAAGARADGHSYLQFRHPSGVGSGDFPTTVSLYPKRDLKIAGEGEASRTSAPQKSASFDASFQPTPEPPKPTAPPPGVQLGTPAGQEALDALARGRAATRAKYATQKVLDSLPNKGVEGRQVFDAALWAKDAGIERLRQIARETPGAMPRLGRAYLEDLFSHATAEGGFGKAQSLFGKWENLGPETKKLLFPNPMHRADLDNFFLIAKKLGEVTNPSQSATVGSIVAGLGYMWTNPATGIPMVVGAGALSKLLHSPAGVRALTEGMRIPVRNTARATIAANRILRIAGDAAQPVPGGKGKVIEFPGAAPSPSPQSDRLSAAASQ